MKRSVVLGAVLLVFVSLLAPQATATTSTKAYIVVLKDSVADPDRG